MVNDVLFELGTEELPSGAVKPLADAFVDSLKAGFKKAQLPFGSIQGFATPRRIAVLIKEVHPSQPDQTIVRRGPAYTVSMDEQGLPTQALLGFARSCNVTIEELTRLKTDKGDWWAYEANKPGAQAKELLPNLVREALAALPIAKPMRWGSGEESFIRPVHWAVLLWGGEVVKTEVFGVVTGRNTYGHRFHHPQAVEIARPLDYERLLHDSHVIADFNKRKQMIVEQVEELAGKLDLSALMPEALIDEVTSIVEWPQALMAGFEPEFLDVPAEALVASMQSHQKCFALRNQKGLLQPYFITVANIASENPEQVIKGNEKVMRARLSDAAFFYHQDQKKSLADYAREIEKVVFQIKLGTLKDKTLRMQALIESLLHPLQLEEKQAKRAVELCKSDLMTGMVGEFPELQGLMGYYYALNDGEDEALAVALNEQYLPRFSGDELPQGNLGLALSLADRLDTLVGIFSIGQKPTGVKDPFKLRRHALAIVRILVAIDSPLSLSTLIERASLAYENSLDKSLIQDVKPFILDRMHSFYQNQGVALDRLAAVLACQDDWLFDLDQRIRALEDFVQMPEAISLAAACKRVNNLLQQVSDSARSDFIDSNLLEESAERALFDHLQNTEQVIAPLYNQGDYTRILTALAELRDPVDAFFDQVMVMVEDVNLKNNRLNLLERLQRLLQGVADISLLTIES